MYCHVYIDLVCSYQRVVEVAVGATGGKVNCPVVIGRYMLGTKAETVGLVEGGKDPVGSSRSNVGTSQHSLKSCIIPRFLKVVQ